MKFVVQLIDHKTGRRSEPFISTPDTLAARIIERDDVPDEDIILVVGSFDETQTEQQLEIAFNPLIKVGTLIKAHFGEHNDKSENEPYLPGQMDSL